MESLDPEANISEIARRNGVSRGLLTVWRRQARELGMAPAPKAMFAAVRIESDADRSDRTAVPADKSTAIAASAIRSRNWRCDDPGSFGRRPWNA